MPAPDAITTDKLAKLIGTPRCPTLLDVRAEPARASDPRLVPAARPLRDAEITKEALERLRAALAAPVVTICAEGHRRSQGVAALLRSAGVPAEYLEGGHAAWVEAGLPLVDPGKITARDAEGRTVWVTRSRLAQEAVGTHGWLQSGEMLDGLGMAETTPGPLIMVLQFVGFLGAFRDAGWESALFAGTLGGLLATWVTFAPCFAWIFLGAPYMERLRANTALSSALTAVTAAVVGVILNLAIWFAIHVIWRQVTRIEAGPLSIELPILGSIDWAAAALSVLALVAVFRLKLGMTVVLGGAAILGLALHLSGLPSTTYRRAGRKNLTIVPCLR